MFCLHFQTAQRQSYKTTIMAKRLKLKFSRVITSFNSCRSKDTSALSSNPVPSFFGLSTVKPHLPSPLPLSIPEPSSSSFKRHVSSAFASISYRFKSRSSLSPPSPPPPEFQWEQEEKWHVVAKIFDENITPRRKIYTSLVCRSQVIDNDSHILLPPANTERKRCRRIRKKKRVIPKVLRISTSSADLGIFSSEGLQNEDDEEMYMDNAETETLILSTRSLSTDYNNSSPEFRPINRISKSHQKKKRIKRAKRCTRRKVRSGRERPPSESSAPARLSTFQWLIPCTVEGKVRESFAVVKKSEDPYEDFKRSMTEMVIEKQMYEVKDLQQLLQCFLSLNSKDHHGVIVEAFCEIWENLFGDSRAVSVN